MSKKNLVMGMIIVGALAGAAVFLSSEKGSKLRKKLRKKGEDTVDKLKNKMNKYSETTA